MTRYKHKIKDVLFDVVEKTIHLHIISRDKSGRPTEIQVHRIRDWYMGDTLFKSETPMATIVPVSDLTEAKFANTGLTLLQAIEVMDAVMNQYTPIVLASEGDPMHDPIPEHATSAVNSLINEQERLKAEVALHEDLVDRRKQDAKLIEDSIADLQQQLQSLQGQAQARGEQVEAAVAAATADLLRLENLIKDRQETIERLDAAIAVKSAESTSLTHEIESLRHQVTTPETTGDTEASTPAIDELP